uniref:Uncharacterized protein n=1 Tax=Myoviridae sp. ctNQV2 TaxID=2827683 RepID=A0A8S5RZZ6_9CAUD|nr:MAG TPA: hypothetical protein [Myoviridae sp. ctNQV2]
MLILKLINTKYLEHIKKNTYLCNIKIKEVTNN